ncbi:helix-turn-helix domain-containing protein [Sphingomonas sp. KC8]|uniref:helix-turn-helix domain-containing protein n=2 Tax=Sphingomonas sp. KC8 TaxID=1030157 RepID=UPI003002875D
MLAVINRGRVVPGRKGGDRNIKKHRRSASFHGIVEYTPWIVARQSRPSRSMSSRENLARNLRSLRTSRGLSQEALAHAAGIDRTYVSALERRKYSISIDRLDRLAEHLGVEPHILLMKNMPADIG